MYDFLGFGWVGGGGGGVGRGGAGRGGAVREMVGKGREERERGRLVGGKRAAACPCTCACALKMLRASPFAAAAWASVAGRVRFVS